MLRKHQINIAYKKLQYKNVIYLALILMFAKKNNTETRLHIEDSVHTILFV